MTLTATLPRVAGCCPLHMVSFRSGAFYPLDECGALLAGLDPDAALDRLYDDVLRHAGGRLRDDSAALFVLRQPS